MKQSIIALLILLFSTLGFASTVQIPEPNSIVTKIPLGVEIRSDMTTMYLICGKPVAISIHTTTGTQIFQGADMMKKLELMSMTRGPIPLVKTELSNAWGDEIACGSIPAPSKTPDKTPEKDHLFIEEMMDRGELWSASHQP